ncbi:GL25705 [Drosophila persimilis]|uniref:GL25705 n=1 Tax=Drosophila persimilis TaxID=7234 RepID=B4GKC7_DROPE|nr:uncharacterized protein LOC6593718 [Drosophila persimilis]EDW37093.1 GL25705 [Drosophila persimilis]
MWNKPSLGIFLLYLMASGGNALPADVARYNKLGQSPTKPASLNCSAATTTNRLGLDTESTPSPPEFEYALLGQDPKDQHWYRVSLTPTKNQTGYRAQFATRKQPPFDDQVAHKHDRTIGELLDWLDHSEERKLLQVYRDVLDDEQRETNQRLDNEVRSESDLRPTKSNHQLHLVGEETTTPAQSPNESEPQAVQNFVYFIKGLE